MKLALLVLVVVLFVASVGTVEAYMMGGYGYGGCGYNGYGYGGYGPYGGYRGYYQSPYGRASAPVGMMYSPWW